jgi:uncharacterized DUF497 family protein
MQFEWDENKNRINTENHGISFYDAQYAFADPKRLILEDENIAMMKNAIFTSA